MDLRPVGTVVRLQVQRSPLKPGVAPLRSYSPAAIVPVPRIRVTPRGAHGLLDDGTETLDVHHADHPETRDRNARAGLTFMTLADYARLRARFGDHVVDGCAGETVLLDGLRPVEGRMLLVETADGALLPVGELRVAAPCVEFTRWCLRLPMTAAVDADVKAAMEFLDHGGRGFRAVALDGPVDVAVGAGVWTGAPVPGAVPVQHGVAGHRTAAGQPEVHGGRR